MEPIILNDRYKLLTRIGVGGMAYVYEAEDLYLKRKVAVKILKEEFVEDEDFLKKFENEAQSAALLNHPNIVNIYDVGRENKEGKDLNYIVMELVVGTTLKDAIQNQGKMSTEVIVRISKQIASALDSAHEKGIVHRDIKPANILITKNGEVKVADFGIARLSSAATITYTSSILGTVHYISPEQAKGRFINKKSDIYSLGVVMYEMATGHVPFDAENSVGIAIKHIQEKPIPPIEENPDIHPGLNRIIMKCLEKDPTDRYHHASDLIYDLKHYKDRQAAGVRTDQDTARIPVEGLNREVKAESHYRSQPDHLPDEEELEEEDEKKGKPKALIYTLLAAVLVLILALAMGHDRRALDGKTAQVPALVNESEETALKLLEDAGLKGEISDRVYSNKVNKDHVVDQSILEGTTVDKGSVVSLTISLGREQVKVPDLTGKTFMEASKSLENAGLSVGRTSYENSDKVGKNRVITSDPKPGTELEAKSKVNLIISQGEEGETTVVPSLIGSDQVDAINDISEANLTLGDLTSSPSSYKAGTVIEQSIKLGSRVKVGTVIDLVISSGPEEEEPEKPEGEGESEEPASMTDYQIKFYPPEGKDSFKVTVYDVNQSKTDPVFSKTFKSDDVNEDGYILQTVKAREDAELKIYYDGVLASTLN